MNLIVGQKYELQTDISYSRGLNGVGFEKFIATVVSQNDESVVLAKEYIGKFIIINKSSIKIATECNDEDNIEIYAKVNGIAYRLHLTKDEIDFYKKNGFKIWGYSSEVKLLTYEEEVEAIKNHSITYGWLDNHRVWVENGNIRANDWGRIDDNVSC